MAHLTEIEKLNTALLNAQWISDNGGIPLNWPGSPCAYSLIDFETGDVHRLPVGVNRASQNG